MDEDTVLFFIRGWKKQKQFHVYEENAPSNSVNITVVSDKWKDMLLQNREDIIRAVFSRIYKNRILNNIHAYTEEEYIDKHY
jgi:hypothetical protein